MRSLPTKFSTDLAANTKEVFYLIVLKADDGDIYWHTSTKAFDLWPNTVASHGGDALTKSGARIALEVDGERIPLGNIRGAISIQMGGGIGAVSNMTLTLLNQDGYNATLGAKNLTNRTVEIRKGFCDTTNGVGVNDMLLVKTFVVDSFEEYDYGTYTLTLTDGSFLRHRDIPNIIVNEDDFPGAPEESLDKPVPILYGDFETFNTTAQYSNGGNDLYPYHFGKYSFAPTVILNEKMRTFAVSEVGPLYSANSPVHFLTDGTYGIIASGFTFGADALAAGYVGLSFDSVAYGDYFVIPKVKGTQYQATNPTYEWDQAVDDDEDTYADATHSSTAPALFGIFNAGQIEGKIEQISSGVSAKTFLVWEVPAEAPDAFAVQEVLWCPHHPSGLPFEPLATTNIAAGGIAKALTVRDVNIGYGYDVSYLDNSELGIRATGTNVIMYLYHACMQLRLRVQSDPRIIPRLYIPRRYRGTPGIVAGAIRKWAREMDAYQKTEPESQLPASNIYTISKGAEYPAWGALDSRTAITPGNLNTKLLYQMESILRDVLFKETHLTADSGTNTTTIVCAELQGEADDYYDDAYVQNFTRNSIVKVTSYSASTKTLTVPTITGQTDGDLFSVFNINGSDQINHASFDGVAATGYDRAGWLGAFSIYEVRNSYDLLSQLASEAGVLWFRDNQNRETIKTLGDRASEFTVTTANVLEVEGIPQIKVSLTSTDELANDFTVNYFQDYGTGSYREKVTLNHKDTNLTDGSRTGFRDGETTYVALCQESRSRYKVERPLVFDMPHVRDAATAEAKLKQLANVYALRRYQVEMDLVMTADTAGLEEGDYIKINHALLPEALRNTAYFVVLDWVEIPESQTYHIVCQETPWGT